MDKIIKALKDQAIPAIVIIAVLIKLGFLEAGSSTPDFLRK